MKKMDMVMIDKTIKRTGLAKLTEIDLLHRVTFLWKEYVTL
jgi:hypothetical protein